MRRIVLGLAAVAAGLAGGCRTVGFGTGLTDALDEVPDRVPAASRRYEGRPQQVQVAALRAMSDLAIRGVTTDIDYDMGQARDRRERYRVHRIDLGGWTADRRPIRITIRPADSRSEVAVRVGPGGDEGLARAVLDRIGDRLDEGPAAEPARDAKDAGSSPFSRSAVPDAIMLRGQAESGMSGAVVP